MHKRLPKANAFIIFVKDETGFDNILRRMSPYPWWNKRAKLVIMVKEKSLLPTKVRIINCFVNVCTSEVKSNL